MMSQDETLLATQPPRMGIVLIAHAPAATGLAALVAHVDASWLTRFAVFDMTPEMTREQAARSIAERVADRGWTQSLLLVDLVGAGPCQAALLALEAIGQGCAAIVTGVNAPMLLSLVARPPFDDLQRAARYALARGRRGVACLGVDIG